MGSVRPRAGRAQCARWLRADAPDHAAAPLPSTVARQVANRERFFNGPSLKERLMSRYLYEHLFLGHLVFEGDAQRHVLRLVRSRRALPTALGHPGAGTIRIFASSEAGLLDYGRLQNR